MSVNAAGQGANRHFPVLADIENLHIGVGCPQGVKALRVDFQFVVRHLTVEQELRFVGGFVDGDAQLAQGLGLDLAHALLAHAVDFSQFRQGLWFVHEKTVDDDLTFPVVQPIEGVADPQGPGFAVAPFDGDVLGRRTVVPEEILDLVAVALSDRQIERLVGPGDMGLKES